MVFTISFKVAVAVPAYSSPSSGCFSSYHGNILRTFEYNSLRPLPRRVAPAIIAKEVRATIKMYSVALPASSSKKHFRWFIAILSNDANRQEFGCLLLMEGWLVGSQPPFGHLRVRMALQH
jgi:hypothetical protein